MLTVPLTMLTVLTPLTVVRGPWRVVSTMSCEGGVVRASVQMLTLQGSPLRREFALAHDWQ